MRQISAFVSTVFPDCFISGMLPTRREGKVGVRKTACTIHIQKATREEADVKKNK